MREIPTLHTRRLTLRAQRPSDTEPLTAAFADDGFSRFITREQRGLSRREAWRLVALPPGMWSANGYGQWMAEERATGQPVGRLGPAPVLVPVDPPATRLVAELEYAIRLLRGGATVELPL